MMTRIQEGTLPRVEDLATTLIRLKDGVHGVISAVDGSLLVHRQHVVETALRHRMPFMSTSRDMVRAGGLMSYGPNFEVMAYRAAGYVHRILRGTRPADLPIEQPTTFELFINARTAKALGLSLPSSLLLQADQVIE